MVAIGEIGLDYHYDFSPRDVQREVFSRQLELAVRLDLPVIVHMREATQDTLALLRAHNGLRGVMHCFSGSAETAEICVGMGLHVSRSPAPLRSKTHARWRRPPPRCLWTA